MLPCPLKQIAYCSCFVMLDQTLDNTRLITLFCWVSLLLQLYSVQ